MTYLVIFARCRHARMEWRVSAPDPVWAEITARNRLGNQLAHLPGGPEDVAEWMLVSVTLEDQP